MTKTEITSYCGDVYEKVEREHHTTYHRMSKASDPTWKPAPRPMTTGEMLCALRAERDKYKAELERIVEHLRLPCDKRDDGLLEQIALEAVQP